MSSAFLDAIGEALLYHLFLRVIVTVVGLAVLALFVVGPG